MLRIFTNSTLPRIVSVAQKFPLTMTKRIPPGRMFSLQDSLPKLPVPALDQTLQKYLRSIRPLLSDEEYQHTEQIVKDFHKNPGPKLQTLLEDRASKEVNWLSDWWASVAYLEFRSPVVVNVSPGVVFPRQSYRDKDGQIRFAAKLISGLLDYKVMVDEQTLQVEYMGKKPLCMSQYYKILSACRIPGKKKDTWTCFPPDEPNPPTHITVIHNNHIFSLEVYGDNKQPLNTDQLYEQLQQIVNMSSTPGTPFGILTTENRSKWAANYTDLCKDKTTKNSLQDIVRSIMVVCLDNYMPDDIDEASERSTAARLMLHGGGSKLNSGNRWFDKTLQFVIGKNGLCGLNYEHTTAEGPPVIAIMDHVLDYCNKDVPVTSPPASGVIPPRKLTINPSQKVLSHISDAEENLDALVKDVDLNVHKFVDYGKNFPKSQKMSPDSFIQNAIQLTYFRIHGEPAAHYETASLRQFQLGRTDTIRSCSIESLNLCKAFDDPSVSKEEKRELLKKAVLSHKAYTNDAVNGQGIDRHLLGLKLTAIKNGMNVPDLHMDTAYPLSTHFKISTSQVPAKSEAVLVFGPVVPDGYGVCYNPQETQILFGVSAFNVSPETDSQQYINMLNKTLLELRDLFTGSMQAKL